MHVAKVLGSSLKICGISLVHLSEPSILTHPENAQLKDISQGKDNLQFISIKRAVT